MGAEIGVFLIVVSLASTFLCTATLFLIRDTRRVILNFVSIFDFNHNGVVGYFFSFVGNHYHRNVGHFQNRLCRTSRECKVYFCLFYNLRLLDSFNNLLLRWHGFSKEILSSSQILTTWVSAWNWVYLIEFINKISLLNFLSEFTECISWMNLFHLKTCNSTPTTKFFYRQTHSPIAGH